MQPSSIQPQSQPPTRRHIIVRIIVGIILLAVIAGVTILVIRTVQRSNLENSVKTEIIKQNKLIKSAAKNNVFSPTLPEGVKSTDTVTIHATVSASGTAYCIDAVSKSNKDVAFYMDKAVPDDSPLKGNCSGNATVPPLVPLDIAIGSVGAGSITLIWSEAPYAASYTAQCATDALFVSGLTSKTVETTQTTFTKLDGKVDYFCRVSAANSRGQSGWSVVVSAVSTAVSIAPKNLKVSTVSRSELSYSWSAVPGATMYVLEYSTDVGFSTDTVMVPTTATSGTMKNLKTYTAYYLHVKAITPGFDSSRAAFSEMLLGRTAK